MGKMQVSFHAVQNGTREELKISLRKTKHNLANHRQGLIRIGGWDTGPPESPFAMVQSRVGGFKSPQFGHEMNQAWHLIFSGVAMNQATHYEMFFHESLQVITLLRLKSQCRTACMLQNSTPLPTHQPTPSKLLAPSNELILHTEMANNTFLLEPQIKSNSMLTMRSTTIEVHPCPKHMYVLAKSPQWSPANEIITVLIGLNIALYGLINGMTKESKEENG